MRVLAVQLTRALSLVCEVALNRMVFDSMAGGMSFIAWWVKPGNLSVKVCESYSRDPLTLRKAHLYGLVQITL